MREARRRCTAITAPVACSVVVDSIEMRRPRKDPCPADPSDLAAFLTKADRDQILCDCNVARIILGPDSQPLDVGREHRTAPRSAAPRHRAQRDRGCRFPDCGRQSQLVRSPPRRTLAGSADPTNINNLVLLCADSTTTSCTAKAGPTPSTAPPTPSTTTRHPPHPMPPTQHRPTLTRRRVLAGAQAGTILYSVPLREIS